MLYESAEFIMAIIVDVVFVRWMVLAVIGSHLIICWTSDIPKLNLNESNLR